MQFKYLGLCLLPFQILLLCLHYSFVYVFMFAPPRGRQSLYLLEGVRVLCLHCLAHFRAV